MHPVEDDPHFRIEWVVVPMLVVFGLAAVLLGGRFLGERVNTALEGDTPTVQPGVRVSVSIPAGPTAAGIGSLLVDGGVIGRAGDFERLVRERGVAAQLKAGTYQLTTGMPLADIVDEIVAGPAPEEVFRLTVLEGLTVSEVLATISDQSGIPAAMLESALLDGTVTTTLFPGAPRRLTDWEGLLFPDTYEFSVNASAGVILSRLAETTEQRMAAVDWSRLDELGINQYEAIIIASIIEEEARLDEDRPLIASVIFNRLDAGMALQIDATVIYALGVHKASLSAQDLEVDSPYNTYQQPGLPPTPIATPRLASLEAAADPASTGFIYYVLVDASGKHGFTDDFDEFVAMKQQAREDGVLP